MPGMSTLKLFTPAGNSVTLAAATTSDRVTVPLVTDSAVPGVENLSLLITNLGPDNVYIELAASSATAVVLTSLPVIAGQYILIKRKAHTSIAGICPTSTATVVFTPGDGA
jgi:hypothetical protein